jgi:hypothetical protein
MFLVKRNILLVNFLLTSAMLSDVLIPRTLPNLETRGSAVQISANHVFKKKILKKILKKFQKKISKKIS